MPQMCNNDTQGRQVIVTETVGKNGTNGFGASANPYTVSISDPSNTVTLNSANNVILPNGTNNTGTVTVTITDTGTGLSTQETLNIVLPGAELSVNVEFIVPEVI